MPGSFLRTAVVRAHRSWHRRRSSDEQVMDTLPVSPVRAPDADFVNQHALRDELWTLLGTLPRAQRVALVLRYFEDLDTRTSAVILGCSESTVRVHLARGLGALRVRLATTASANGEAR